MATYEKKQSKALTEKTKKHECFVCGRMFRITKKNEDVCNECKKLYKKK